MATEPAAPPAAPSTSTSGPDVDKAGAPGRVGPTKLAGKRPAPVESTSTSERVGPHKVRVTTTKES